MLTGDESWSGIVKCIKATRIHFNWTKCTFHHDSHYHFCQLDEDYLRLVLISHSDLWFTQFMFTKTLLLPKYLVPSWQRSPRKYMAGNVTIVKHLQHIVLLFWRSTIYSKAYTTFYRHTIPVFCLQPRHGCIPRAFASRMIKLTISFHHLSGLFLFALDTLTSIHMSRAYSGDNLTVVVMASVNTNVYKLARLSSNPTFFLRFNRWVS